MSAPVSSDPAARAWAFFSFGEDEWRRGAGGVGHREEELVPRQRSWRRGLVLSREGEEQQQGWMRMVHLLLLVKFSTKIILLQVYKIV